MDRLVIESILSETEKIYVSNDSESAELGTILMLGFKADHAEQVVNAFTALKNITHDKAVELVICKTLASGIYDVELKTDALDEPVRILNKAIPDDLLLRLENQLQKNRKILLGTNVSEQESWISLTHALVKECAVKEK
ncbi:hypothetical protein [Pedobacter sp. WC2423]|uniref:hypothetical protein n=1 Tax=Pedobacter sp. WC2423 TaxID=3234142 RepID=UPI0034672669